MITATAPGACCLAGDPSDLYGGSVLSCSTRERARCTLNTDVEDTVITVFGHSQTIHTASDLGLRDGDALNVARAVLAALEVVPGQTPPLHLTAETDIPLRAGLAGSAALLATITGCVLTHLGLRLNPYETAELIRKIEADVLGVRCGFLDHYVAVFGGLNFSDFRGKDSAQSQGPTMPFATMEPLEKCVSDLPLVLTSFLAEQSPSPSDPMTEQDVLTLATLARSVKRSLLAQDWDACGEFMNQNHALLRDHGGSGEASERLIAAALAGGASGAKLAGADGKAVLVLTCTPARTVDALQAAGAAMILSPHPAPGLTVSVEVTV